jgi:hypothetical protein
LTQGSIDNATRLFSKVVYSGWITRRLALLKRFVLKKTLQPDADDMGKLEVVDDLLTGVFYLVYLFHVLQYMEVQTGLAIKVSMCYSTSLIPHLILTPTSCSLCFLSVPQGPLSLVWPQKILPHKL